MTRQEATKIIEERIRIDREGILNGGEPESDFDKFVAKQDEALELALNMLKSPVDFLNPHELISAYWKQQNIYDIDDMRMNLDSNSEWYAEEFDTDKNPVTEEEVGTMAEQLRKMLNYDADAVWSTCCNDAAIYVLSKRKKQ